MEDQIFWGKLKKKYPKFYVFIHIIIILSPFVTYAARPYADYYVNPNPQLEYNLAGDDHFFLSHISSYNLWIKDTNNLVQRQSSIIDIQVQNKYDQPLLTYYDFTKINGIIVNVSYNGQSKKNIDTPIAINSHEWNHFYLDVYVIKSNVLLNIFVFFVYFNFLKKKIKSFYFVNHY